MLSVNSPFKIAVDVGFLHLKSIMTFCDVDRKYFNDIHYGFQLTFIVFKKYDAASIVMISSVGQTRLINRNSHYA